MKVKVRFAPSPTGSLHLGGLRTALVNLYFARKHNGKVIFRLENTDARREIPGSGENIFKILQENFNFDFDSSPYNQRQRPGKQDDDQFESYVQSQRLPIYRKFVEDLMQRERAYKCFCSRERLASLKQKTGQVGSYDGYCRHLSKKEISEKMALGLSHVIRFNSMNGSESNDNSSVVTLSDKVFGRVEFDPNQTVSDFILLKSDQMPSYHLANVVDDHLMEISHVIRGMEWLTSTPSHLLLYKAFDWKPPTFAHLPLLMHSDGTKISKRHNDQSVENLLKSGLESEALENYLFSISCKSSLNDGKGIFSRNQMISQFELEHLSNSNLKLNLDDLETFNHRYIRNVIESGNHQAILCRIKKLLQDEKIPFRSDEQVCSVLDLSADTLKKISSFPKRFENYFERPKHYQDRHVKLFQENRSNLEMFLASYKEEGKSLEQFLQENKAISRKLFMQILRIAAIDCSKGPPISKMIHYFGNEEFYHRIQQALKFSC